MFAITTSASPSTTVVGVEEVVVVDAVEVPAGAVGIVTSLTGERSDKDLVDEGERGVWRKVLRPGTYYMNRKGYSIEV